MYVVLWGLQNACELIAPYGEKKKRMRTFAVGSTLKKNPLVCFAGSFTSDVVFYARPAWISENKLI